MGDHSRRTSYYGGGSSRTAPASPHNGISRTGTNKTTGPGGYNRHEASYHGRNQSRPDSIVDGYQANNAENYYPYQNHNQNPNGRRRPGPRVSADQNGYQNHAYQRSYDNVTALSGSGTGSGYTDPYGQGTDPSSMNSSVDQLQQHALLQQQHQHQQQQRLDERAQDYGVSFGNTPNWNNKGLPSAPAPVASPTSPGTVAQQHFAAPAKKALRKDVPQAGDKRKSWFKRRFSKD